MNKGVSNLIPLSERTPEEVKEITTKGAIASNKAQARRKTFKEIFELLLQEKAIDGSNLTNDELLALQMIAEAHKGNTKAFEIVRDTVGEKPREQMELGNIDDKPLDINLRNLTVNEIRELLKNEDKE